LRTGKGRHNTASAEDQCIETDADGEECDRNQREPGAPGELPHGKAKIGHRAILEPMKIAASITPEV